jgi:peptidoglycan/LPS O-acetylase OafA/YrhL
MNERLDAIKGIAILWVVAFHMLLLPPFHSSFLFTYCSFIYPRAIPPISGLIPQIHSLKELLIALISIASSFGYQGVHVFFIASGFGLTVSFLEKGIKLPQWYLRRARRILPMYWLSLAVSIFLQRSELHALPAWELSKFIKGVLLHAACLHVLVPEYFYSINPAVWYMGLLLQFYLSFPYLCKLVARYGPSRVFAFSVIATVTFRLLGIYWIDQFHPYFSLGAFFGCRLAEFVFGIAFAYYIKNHSPAWANIPLLIAMPLYFCGILFHCSILTTAMSDMTIGISVFMILWHISRHFKPFLLKKLSFIGRRSFGIFLFHYALWNPAYELIRQIGVQNIYLIYFLLIIILSATGILIDVMENQVQNRIARGFRTSHDS